MIANARENEKLKLKVGRSWSRHFGRPILTHGEVARELGLPKRAVKQAEAKGAFRFFAVAAELLDGQLPCGVYARRGMKRKAA